MVNLRQSAARAAAIASDFGTNSAGWENSTGSTSLGEMITRVPMRTLSNGFSANPKGIRTQPCEGAYPGNGPPSSARPFQVMRSIWHIPGIVVEARAMVLVLLHEMKTPAGVSRPAVPLDTGNNISTQEPRRSSAVGSAYSGAAEDPRILHSNVPPPLHAADDRSNSRQECSHYRDDHS